MEVEGLRFPSKRTVLTDLNVREAIWSFIDLTPFDVSCNSFYKDVKDDELFKECLHDCWEKLNNVIFDIYLKNNRNIDADQKRQSKLNEEKLNKETQEIQKPTGADR